MQPAVFLDRDGTINEQMGYVNHICRFVLLPGVEEAIGLLNDRGIPVIVVTNQSGLGRGYFPEALLEEVHEELRRRLLLKGVRVDGIYVCPHHPEAKVEKYRVVCDCRKPKPGLFLKAAADFSIDLTRSYVVGDRWTDIRAARGCGARSVLVLTGYGRGDREYVGPYESVQPDWIGENLHKAVTWILADMDRRERGEGKGR